MVRDSRTASWNRDPRRSAFVLVVTGRFGYPPVYIKWLLPPPGVQGGRLTFLSFHASTKTDA
jgi:hypothetical protein